MSSVIKLSKLNGIKQAAEAYVIDHQVEQETAPPEAPPEFIAGFDAVEEIDSSIEDQDECEEVETEPEPDLAELARMEAEAILEEARSQADAIRRDAYEQGYRQGQEAGEAGWADKAAELAGLIGQIDADREALFALAEPQLVKLSLEIAEKVIRHELSAGHETVLDMVKAGLRQLRDKETIKIRINPADVEMIKLKRQDLMDAFDGIRNIEITDDRRIERGGCLIDAPGGVLDMRIKTQIKEIDRVLTEAAADHAGTGDTGSE